MNILLLNGLGEEFFYNQTIELIREKLNKYGNTEEVVLKDKKIGHCIGCFKCWSLTPGECIKKDGSFEICKKYFKADKVIILSNITFGGYSSITKSFLDRIIKFMMPTFKITQGELHHKPRYDTYPELMSIGISDCTDEEDKQNFQKLLQRNAINIFSKSAISIIIEKGDQENEVDSEVKKLFIENVGGELGEQESIISSR